MASRVQVLLCVGVNPVRVLLLRLRLLLLVQGSVCCWMLLTAEEQLVNVANQEQLT